MADGRCCLKVHDVSVLAAASLMRAAMTDGRCRLVLFCFVLFSLQLSVCLWWHDYRRDDFPTLKFGVVIADLLAIC